MVGGVSIGAFMGAMWCGERDIITMTQKAAHWSKVCTEYIIYLVKTITIIIYEEYHTNFFIIFNYTGDFYEIFQTI